MSFDEFLKLLLRADQSSHGCTVEFVAVNTLDSPTPAYGVIAWGHKENKRIFHNLQELREVLTMLGEK